MRNLKKFLALVLALTMVLSVMVTVNAADLKPDGEINPKYQTAIDVLAGLDIIKGNRNGVYKPDEPITRAEFALMLYRVATGDAGDEYVDNYADLSDFADVPEGHWARGAIGYVQFYGYMIGTGGDKFSPNAPITGFSVLLSLLRLIGYDYYREITDATNGWTVATVRQAKLVRLYDDVIESDQAWTKDANRQVIAQLIFTTLTREQFIAPTGTNNGYNDSGLKNTDGHTFTGTIGDEHFNLKKESANNDNFGRPTDGKWTYGTGDDAGAVFARSSNAVVTYTGRVGRGAVDADLTNYTWNTNEKVTAKIDGKDATNSSNKQDGYEIEDNEELANLTGPGTIVEVYAGGNGNGANEISAVVVIKLYAGKVTEASKKLQVNEKNLPDGSNAEKDDVVAYTLANDMVEDVYATEKVTGALSSYTAAGVYTVSGAEYSKLDRVTLTAANLGKEQDFYTYNGVIVMTEGAEEPDETPTDYAIVLKAHVVRAKPDDDWATDENESDRKTYTAEMQIVQSNGKLATYTLPLAQATEEDVKDTTHFNGLSEGDWYFMIGGVAQKMDSIDTKGDSGDATTDAELDELITSKTNKTVYAYSVADGVITLYDIAVGNNEPGESTIVATTVHSTESDPIKSNTTSVKINEKRSDQSPEGKDAIINNNTVFVVYDQVNTTWTTTNKSTISESGIATTVSGCKVDGVVARVTVSGTSAKTYQYEILYVFVARDGYTAATTTDTAENATYVYVDASTLVTGTAPDGEATYTVTVLMEDGTETTMAVADAEVQSGIYKLNDDGALNKTKENNENDGDVTYYSGGVLTVGTSTGNVTAKTKIVGNLVVGATVAALIDGTSKGVSVVFVLAPPAAE